MPFLERPEGRLAIALAVGLIIGAERERRKTDAPVTAGIRTFTLVALLGGIVASLESVALLTVMAAVVGAAAIASYVIGERGDPGLTTEVALILTYCLGAYAMRAPALALAVGVSVAALLAFRAQMHDAVRKVLTQQELLDGLIFAVAALVVWPFLPREPIDPWGAVNPFTLWRLVVLVMAMSASGYIAERVIGPRYGLAAAGFASGFVSSSATIAAMGARATSEPELLRPAVAGATASSVATFVQLAVLVGGASPKLLVALGWPLLAGGGMCLLWAALQTWKARRAPPASGKGRAFKLSTAIFFAGLVSLVAFLARMGEKWLGQTGAVVAAAVAALADAHAAAAAVASLSAGDQLPLFTAELGVLVAVSTNAVTKTVLAITSGPRAFWWRVVLGQILALGALWGAFVAHTFLG